AQHQAAPTLIVTLPAPTEVAALRLTPSASALPTHPTLVAIDLGDGPQVRSLTTDGGAQTVELHPRVTGSIRVSLLDWDDVIDRTALGFDQLKPPGLSEITALRADRSPIAAADAAANAARRVEVPCGQGPVIAVSGRFIQTSVSATVGDLLAGRPIAARLCDPTPVQLQAGQQELLVSPGAAFIADGAQIDGPLAAQLAAAPTAPAELGDWTSDRRQITLARSPATRVLVVPESVNPGWVAHAADGAELTPVIVNGWQQGWVVPAGEQGAVTLSFGSNGPYRTGLGVGLSLLPVLALMALVPPRRRLPSDEPAEPRTPGALGVAGLLGAAALIGGLGGVGVFGAALLAAHRLRDRPRLRQRLTLTTAATGLIAAGALLSRYPWRSVDGYIGHSPWVQLPALIALAAVAASLIPMPTRWPLSGGTDTAATTSA
ncbi:MAG: hypothetical protein ACR2JM_15705, partial [Mycobacterium sp.]